MTVLQDKTFVIDQVEKKLESAFYPIIHFATHGNFDSDLSNTFLLAYDGQITMDKLKEMIDLSDRKWHKPIDLLTLSACQTAKGDDRAALGLAGVAVKAGVRSVLATLWNVDDKATADLMANFYQQLGDKANGGNKARALQKAQQKLIQENYKYPYFWAPFLLIGDWGYEERDSPQ